MLASFVRSPRHWLVAGFLLCRASLPIGEAYQTLRPITTVDENLKIAPRTTAIKIKPATPALPVSTVARNCKDNDDFHFQSIVLLTLKGRPDDFTSADTPVLERSFTRAYNSVAKCGGDSKLTGAFIHLQQVTLTNNVEGLPAASNVLSSTALFVNSTQYFTVLAVAKGSCRGCQTKSFQLWRSARRNRFRGLQKERQPTAVSITAKISKSGNRGGAGGYDHGSTPAKRKPLSLACTCLVPTKSALLNALNNMDPLPSSVETVLDVTEFNPIPQCPKEKNFSTYLTLDFTAGSQDTFDVTNVESQYQVLQQAVVRAYNDANSFGSTSVCDPTFTILTEAEVVVSPDSGYGATGLNRRHLTESPNASVSDPLFVFFIRGRCRGCSDSADLFSEAARRRNRRGLKDLDNRHQRDGYSFHQSSVLSDTDQDHNRRRLPIVNGECVCPVSTAQFRRPTMDEYQQVLNQQLQGPESTDSLTIVSQARESLQVAPVNCSAKVTFFQAVVTLDFSGNASSLTPDQLAAFGQTFQTTYNSLAMENCDPLFRTVDSVQFVGTLPSNNRRQLTAFGGNRSHFFLFSSLLLLISGRCRGCPRKTALFNDVAVNKGRLLGLTKLQATFDDLEVVDNARHDLSRARKAQRILQQASNQTDQCYCYVAANKTRAPTLDEFRVAYNQTIASTNVTSTFVVTTVNEPSNLSVTFPPSEAPAARTHRPTSSNGSPSNQPVGAPSVSSSSPPASTTNPLSPTILPNAPFTASPSSPPALPVFVAPLGPTLQSLAPVIISPTLESLAPVVTPVVPVVTPVLPVVTPVVPVVTPVLPVVTPVVPVVTPVLPVVTPVVPVVTPVLPMVTPVVPIVTPVLPVVTPVVPVVTPVLPVVTPIVPVVTPVLPVVTPVVPVVTPVVPVVTPVVPVVTPVLPVVTPVVPVVTPVVPVVTPVVTPALPVVTSLAPLVVPAVVPAVARQVVPVVVAPVVSSPLLSPI